MGLLSSWVPSLGSTVVPLAALLMLWPESPPLLMSGDRGTSLRASVSVFWSSAL